MEDFELTKNYSSMKSYIAAHDMDGQKAKMNIHKVFKTYLLELTNFLDEIDETANSPLAVRIWCIQNDVKSPPRCMNDGCDKFVKPTKTTSGVRKLADFCSPACSGASTRTKFKRKKTCMDRYGVDNHMKDESIQETIKEKNIERYGKDSFFKTTEFKKKTRATLIERYGVEHPQKLQTVREKTIRTNIERYGAANPLQCEDVKTKQISTVIERYGVDNISKSDDVKEKKRNTLMERYGVDSTFDIPEVKKQMEKVRSENGGKHHTQYHIESSAMEILNSKDILESMYLDIGVSEMINVIGVADCTIYSHMRRHNIPLDASNHISGGEQALRNFVETIISKDDLILNDKSVLCGKEIDILIPSKGIGIEFNGVYWHCDKFRKYSYHQKKSLEAKDQGIQLIHVWEDDWKDHLKRSIIEDKIRQKLGLVKDKVYARQTEVRGISHSSAREFLNSNHIQGMMHSSSFISLVDSDNEVVAIMGYKEQIAGAGIFEITRYATSKTVVGGFSKLLSHFKKIHDWKTLVTFAHLDYSNGDMYEKTGFTKVKITSPGMWYVKGDKRFRREKFMKHKLKDKLESYDPTLSELQNMRNHGFNRIYDCGSIRYEMKNQD